MANDINNTSGTTTGNQNQGTIVVSLGKAGTISKNTKDQAVGSIGHAGQEDNSEESTVASIASKYDGRFDDPGYYP